MTVKQLYQELNYVNHTREKRLHYANLVMANPDIMPQLLEILFMVNDKVSTKAAWVIEYVVREDLNFILPYIDLYVKKLHTIKLDSSLRPAAKICELLISAYYSKNPCKTKAILTINHREKIAETCFDWLIQDQKVAVKAHCMLALFFLGKEFDWIHPELKLTLEKDVHTESAAYKARSRNILAKMNTLEKHKKKK